MKRRIFSALHSGADGGWRIREHMQPGYRHMATCPDHNTAMEVLSALQDAVLTDIELNQCDGCRRELPVVDGIHRGDGFDLIACSADRYRS